MENIYGNNASDVGSKFNLSDFDERDLLLGDKDKHGESLAEFQAFLEKQSTELD